MSNSSRSKANKDREEAAINELAGGDRKSKGVLQAVAQRFDSSDAIFGLVKMIEDVGIRGQAIGEFHAIACGGSDQLFLTVIANEATGVTTFGIAMYSSPDQLRDLAEKLAKDGTTQKMKRTFG